VKDLHELPGYHPAHDQVVAIAVRPLTEQVFRWQQRLNYAAEVSLRLELESDHVEWFPARFRHILDNLLAHTLRSRSIAVANSWVCVGLRVHGGGYELRVTDNGPRSAGDDQPGFDPFYRAGPLRGALSSSLAVVRLLIEQSGGTIMFQSREGSGTEF